MKIKQIVICVALLLVQLSVFGQGKAAPDKAVILNINGNKIELVDSKMKIADLNAVKVELSCEDKPVEIKNFSAVYSSKELNKVGEIQGEGAPKDLSNIVWEADVDHKHLHSGALVLLKCTYIVANVDGDEEQESTWMIELE